jgi:hypothetical protein
MHDTWHDLPLRIVFIIRLYFKKIPQKCRLDGLLIFTPPRCLEVVVFFCRGRTNFLKESRSQTSQFAFES